MGINGRQEASAKIIRVLLEVGNWSANNTGGTEEEGGIVFQNLFVSGMWHLNIARIGIKGGK